MAGATTTNQPGEGKKELARLRESARAKATQFYKEAVERAKKAGTQADEKEKAGEKDELHWWWLGWFVVVLRIITG